MTVFVNGINNQQVGATQQTHIVSSLISQDKSGRYRVNSRAVTDCNEIFGTDAFDK